MFEEDTFQSSATINTHLQQSMTTFNHQVLTRWPPRTVSKSQASIAFPPTTQTSDCSPTTRTNPRPSATITQSALEGLANHEPNSSSNSPSSTPSSTTSISDSSRKPRQAAEPPPSASSGTKNPSHTSLQPSTPSQPPHLISDLKYLHSRARCLSSLLTYQGSLITACRTLLAAHERSRNGFYTRGDCTAPGLPGPLMPPAPTSCPSPAITRNVSSHTRPRTKTASRHVHWADEEERRGLGEALGLGISNISLGEEDSLGGDRVLLQDKTSTRLALHMTSKDRRKERMDGGVLEERVKNKLKKLMFGYQEIALQLAVVEVEIELVVLRWWNDAWVEDF